MREFPPRSYVHVAADQEARDHAYRVSRLRPGEKTPRQRVSRYPRFHPSHSRSWTALPTGAAWHARHP